MNKNPKKPNQKVFIYKKKNIFEDQYYLKFDKRTKGKETKNLINMLMRDVLYKLTARGKVEQAAIYNFDGEKIATTDGVELSSGEIKSLIQCLTDRKKQLVRMKIAGTTYTCMLQTSANAFVGRADESLFVACKCKRSLLVGLAHTESPGSCIYEITKFSSQIRQRGY